MAGRLVQEVQVTAEQTPRSIRHDRHHEAMVRAVSSRMVASPSRSRTAGEVRGLEHRSIGRNAIAMARQRPAEGDGDGSAALGWVVGFSSGPLPGT